MAVAFPKHKPPYSDTQENQWSSFTKAKFNSVAPTPRLLGRVTADIPDTQSESDPCSFLAIFKSFASNKLVDQYLKCQVRDKVPYLKYGNDYEEMPVDSATVTRQFHDDNLVERTSELEIASNGKTFSCLSSPHRIQFSQVEKRPRYTIYRSLFVTSD